MSYITKKSTIRIKVSAAPMQDVFHIKPIFHYCADFSRSQICAFIAS